MSDAAPPPPTCPICARPMQPRWRPFCSRRCADVDLNRWLSGVYAVAVTEEEDEDGDAPPPAGDAPEPAPEPARVIDFRRPRGRNRG